MIPLKLVEIEINSECNMSCSYCPNSIAERKEQGEMSPELFNKIVEDLLDMEFAGVVSFHFYNEPLLSKNIINFTRILKEKLQNTILQIYTNGTLLSYQKFQELIKAGVDLFVVTQHEATKDNYKFLKTMKSLTEQERTHVKFQSYRELAYSNRAGTLNELGAENTTLLPCLLPSAMMVITVEGNVLPCYEDFKQELEMGSVLNESIADIWSCNKFSDFRDRLSKKGGRLSNPTCEKCNNVNIPLLNK